MRKVIIKTQNGFDEREPKSILDIKGAMKLHGETNASLADKLSMTPAAISQMLKSEKTTLPTIYKIACAMNIDPRELFVSSGDSEAENETPNVVMKPEVTCPYCSKRFTLHDEL